jgi:hypothetical protein
MILWLSFGTAQAEPSADSATARDATHVAESAGPVPAAAIDSTPPAVSPPPAATPDHSRRTRPEGGISRKWQLTLDFADISDSGLGNARHLHQTVDQTNLCCLDIAWIPWVSRAGWIQAGGFGNLGGWHQDLDDNSAVTMVDFALGPSLLGSIPLGASGRGWARLDLGVSNLLIHRRTTGMDWGLAGAVRVGAAFPLWGALGFFGGGMDFRDYWHLDVGSVPALTLFVGEWI